MKAILRARAIGGMLAALAVGASAAYGAERLTLADAVTRAHAEAASVRIADLRHREVERDVARARSRLLPTLRGSAFAANRTFNLATFGIPSGGTGAASASDLIGPLHEVDARLSGTQALVDVSSLKRVLAAKDAAGASGAEAANEASEAAYRAGIAYIQAARAEALIAARQADLELADELLSLARARLASGAAASIDVTRAQTELAETRELTLIARNDAAAARIQLGHTLGLPADSQIELADTLSDSVTSAVPVADSTALAFAREHRNDLKAARANLLAARRSRAATGAERLPSLGLSGDIGWSGTNTSDAIATREIAIELSVPLWDGLDRESRLEQQSLIVEEASVRIRDIEQRVAADVRTALLALATGLERESIAGERLALSSSELDQARERFANGIAGNIEVIDAQSSLNRAREAVIGARAAVALARVELARAAGLAETVRQP